MKAKGNGMTTIKIRQSTQTRIRDFADGLGGTYDRMVNFLLDEIRQQGESDISAGVRLRGKFKSQQTDDSPPDNDDSDQ